MKKLPSLSSHTIRRKAFGTSLESKFLQPPVPPSPLLRELRSTCSHTISLFHFTMQKRACFDHIWKRALGNGDKAVAIVSLLKTARAIEKESLEIRNFIKSQIATGRLSKKLGSNEQIMTIWARSTNDFADPFTPEAATLISEVSSCSPSYPAL